MNAPSPVVAGIAPQHVPSLIAVLCLPLAVWAALRLLRALRSERQDWTAALLARYEGAPLLTRVRSALLAITAAVHLALPFGHPGTLATTPAFLAAGAALAGLGVLSLTERRWKPAASLMLTTSIVAYLAATGSGREEADQLGIATKLVELAALGLILIPRGRHITETAPRTRAQSIRRRLAAAAASMAIVALTVTTGAVVWIGSFVAHAQADAVEAAPHTHAPGTALHGHGHRHAARAQAGTIMRPSPGGAPTAEQALAAARLAKETRKGVARFEDYRAAIAAGYKPDRHLAGLDVHFNNEAYGKDGRILDPTRPEMLVYAFENGRYLLLGAVYLMERAGQPGPEIGGSITRWHAHNVCVTLLPPGFTLVSPFGTCPTASLAITVPEMIHVWTVANPRGPYADALDEAFVRARLQRAGRPGEGGRR